MITPTRSSRWQACIHQAASVAALGAALLVGCAHGKAKPEAQQQAKKDTNLSTQAVASNGPVVTDEKAQPSTIELNRFLQPKAPHEFVVEVRDPVAEVTDVRLQIPNSEITVPMESIGANLWRGTLNEDQFQALATGGRIVEYQARVIAKDSNGNVAMGQKPLKFRISSPNLEDRISTG